MYTKRSFLFLILIIGFYSASKSQNGSTSTINYYKPFADSILTYSLKNKTGYNWLRELCDIGPRLSASENSELAIKWAFNKFIEMGCDTVWLQPVMVPKWVRGEKESAIIRRSDKHEGRQLSIASLGRSVGTEGKEITGQVLEIKRFEDVKKLTREAAEGKILFFNEPFDEELSATFRAYGKAVKQRTQGVVEAAKLGAIAAVVRSVTSKHDNVPHVGTLSYVDSLKKVPGVAIGLQDANFLSGLLLEEPDIEVSIELSCKNYPEVESYNVIADIRGYQFPDEVIVVGGHFDSWDKGCGAHDDGAPCIQTMETLHQMIALNLQPKRTIRCVLFINEENGIRGAVRYGEYSANSAEKHIAAIESDRGAFIPQGFNVTAEDEIIAKMQNWLPVLNKTKIDWVRKGGSGVDISRIKGATALIGYVPDDQRYFDVHHSANDTFESVNAREMQFGTAAITLLAYIISQEGL